MQKTYLAVVVIGLMVVASCDGLHSRKADEAVPSSHLSPFHEAVIGSSNRHLPLQPDDEAWSFTFNGTIQGLVPLREHSGVVVPVGQNPRYALTIKVERCFPRCEDLKEGELVTFAIESATRLFGPKCPDRLRYTFSASRVVSGGHSTFSSLIPARYGRDTGHLASTDDATGITYTVEDDGRHVVATGGDGTTIWRRDPFSDAKLEPYRVEHPVIASILFTNDRTKPGVSVRFDSSQFGMLDPKTGDFAILGQD